MTSALKEILDSKGLGSLMHILLDLGNSLNGAGMSSHHRASVQLARGFKLESLSKLKSTKSFNRRTSALHFLVANIEKCTLGTSLSTPVKKKDESSTPGGDLFGIINELPTLQAAKRLCYADSHALIDEMRKGLSVLEAEIAKMGSEDGNEVNNSKLEEFVEYVKISITEVDSKSKVLHSLMVEAGKLFGQDVTSGEAASKEPAYMFNLIYEFLEALSSARLERKQVDACHKVVAGTPSKAVGTPGR